MKETIQKILDFITDAWGVLCIVYLFINYLIFLGCFLLGGKIYELTRGLKK